MTKIARAIITAAEKGYTALPCGTVIGIKGHLLKVSLRGTKRRQYKCFSVVLDGVTINVPVHRFIGYLKFGAAALASGVCVRHLNDNPTDNTDSNIAIGSRSDNMMDRPKTSRVLHAQKAGQANSKSPETWEKIRADHREGMSYKSLKAKYGVPMGTLSYQLSTKAKRTALV